MNYARRCVFFKLEVFINSSFCTYKSKCISIYIHGNAKFLVHILVFELELHIYYVKKTYLSSVTFYLLINWVHGFNKSTSLQRHALKIKYLCNVKSNNRHNAWLNMLRKHIHLHGTETLNDRHSMCLHTLSATWIPTFSRTAWCLHP